MRTLSNPITFLSLPTSDQKYSQNIRDGISFLVDDLLEQPRYNPVEKLRIWTENAHITKIASNRSQVMILGTQYHGNSSIFKIKGPDGMTNLEQLMPQLNTPPCDFVVPVTLSTRTITHLKIEDILPPL